MKDFTNKVAVITGAASGIGRGLAYQCAVEGMKIVLADIEKEPLLKVEKELKQAGAETISILMDVSKLEDVERLANTTIKEFGEIDLLFNNAGVGTKGNIWESTINDWKWVLGVNLWGVIHGVKIFTPIMLKQDRECFILNTASGFALINGSSIYGMTKRGILSLSESLSMQLKHIKSKIKVAVLIPGFVNTNITTSARNRPSELQNKENILEGGLDEKVESLRYNAQGLITQGMNPDYFAKIVFHGIRKNKFHIIGDPGIKFLFNTRVSSILRDIKYFEKHISEIK
jgi:short-subunit dehydrogenase